jgi:hypothetical protein
MDVLQETDPVEFDSAKAVRMRQARTPRYSAGFHLRNHIPIFTNNHGMFSTLIRRSAEAPKPLFDFDANPYKVKRIWPPDFSKLSPKHQFRLERRYKRRAKLKWARPRWTKGVKLAQWGSGICMSGSGPGFLEMVAYNGYSCINIRSLVHGLGKGGYAFPRGEFEIFQVCGIKKLTS